MRMTMSNNRRGVPLAYGKAAPSGVRDALLLAAREELAVTGTSGISLRAIARRAGVSHAAPKHHFGDRAGLLTALAVEGFERLLAALERAGSSESGAPDRGLAALGRAYVDAGMSDPRLFELMFRPELLHPDDPDLRAAQKATFDLLGSAVANSVQPRPGSSGADPGDVSLVAWAFVHGVVVLVRDGALQAVSDESDAELLAHRLTLLFVDLVSGPPRA